MSLHRRSGRMPARVVAVRGVTLVELMVALVLGLIVAGSALALFMTNRQTMTATENLGRVQESTRVAFELMARDLRRATGNPCDARKLPANGLVNPGANWWSNWGIGLQSGLLGYADTTAFADAAFGTTEGARVAGTDAIEVKAAVVPTGGAIVVPALCTVSGQDLIPDDAAIAVTSVAGLSTGDLLVLCNYANATLFQATGFSANAIEHGNGGSAWENELVSLQYMPNPAAACDLDLISNEEGSMVAKLQASRWYVGCNGRVACDAPGGRSLYRASLVNNAGTPDVAVDEVATGVTDMVLTYLADGATDYVLASAIADWNDVDAAIIAVRVKLTLAGEDRVGIDGAGNSTFLERELVHTVAIRNRSP